MAVSILLIFVIALGGFAVTYIFADDEPLMWRLASGNVIGSAVFGTLAFIASMAAGFNVPVLIFCLLASLLTLLAFRNTANARVFKHDWAKAKGKLRGANMRKFSRFAYYAFFFLLFVFFFRRGMIETSQGIFTGASQNLGDLPFHLGAIFGFTDGNNFPPQNPSFSGARFSYPFVADLLTASFTRLGAGVADAMFVQHVSWAFSLLVILERFVVKLTGDRLAGRIGPALLFFSGGLGFIAFFTDFGAQARSITDFLWHIPTDYTIGEHFRWGNSLVVLFITQRSLLLGMPLTILVLGGLWKVFTAEAVPGIENGELRIENKDGHQFSILHSPFSIFLTGLLAGLLPLIHLHSLAVLFVVGVFLFILQPHKWKLWLIFAAGVALMAIPELLWSIAGSASETSKFIGWHYGWNKGENDSFLWFWFVNTGIFIPLLALGLYLVWTASRNGQHAATREDISHAHKSGRHRNKITKTITLDRPHLLLFYIPFAFLFVVSNVAKFAPWEWDNIKILIYWFIGSLPFAAYALAWLWQRTSPWKAAAIICFVALTLSGSIDVWRTVSGQINYKVFDRDAVLLAEKIKQSAPPNAVFLNAPTYNTAVVLTGRRSMMRYIGHLSSHGIDFAERESDLKRIYLGGPDAAAMMEKYGIDYVLISPEERNTLSANEAFFSKYPVAAESGQYRVYQIR
ncbi:MAG: hypothetical protein ABI791_01460 [Acidobacteriota bacterium]